MWPAAAAAAAAASPRPGIDIVMVARVAGLQLQQQHNSSFISDQSSAPHWPLSCLGCTFTFTFTLLLTELQHAARAADNAMSNGKIAEY